MNWIKQNWFKLSIVVTMFLIAGSIAYYCFIIQGRVVDSEMQEKCRKATKELVVERGWDKNNAATYQCHYNKKLNKYIALIVLQNGNKYYNFLWDVCEYRPIGDDNDKDWKALVTKYMER